MKGLILSIIFEIILLIPLFISLVISFALILDAVLLVPEISINVFNIGVPIFTKLPILFRKSFIASVTLEYTLIPDKPGIVILFLDIAFTLLVKRKKYEMVKLLYFCKPEVIELSGEAIVKMCGDFNYNDLIPIIISNNKDSSLFENQIFGMYNALSNACYNNNIEIARLIINKYPKSCYFETSKTALKIACEKKLENIALEILESGYINVDYEFSENIIGNYVAPNIPLIYLVCSNKLDKVAMKLLDLSNDNIDYVDNKGNVTALHKAIMYDMTNVAIKLMECGAKNSLTLNNMDALYLACKNCNYAIANKILDMDLQISDSISLNKKDTPLHLACQNGMIEIAIKIIEKCDKSLIFHYDANRQTPWDIANMNKLIPVIQEMINYNP